MGLQRNCIGLANRPSCCCRAVAELLSMVRTSFNQPRRSSLFVAQYRRNDGNEGEGTKSIFLLKTACFSFDRGRAIRPQTSRSPSTKPAAFAVRPISLRLDAEQRSGCGQNCNGPAHRPSISARSVSDQAWADFPSKFGYDESALVLTTEQRWDCRETASLLPTGRRSCCGQAVADA
jgi:hypothetical protein